MQTALNYEWTMLSTGTVTMPEFRSARLRERRKDVGFTQVTLAKAMQVKQSQISAWEKGEVKPEISNVSKMAKALEVSIDYLYGLVDKPQDTLKEQGLSEFEFKVVHRIRIDPEAERRVDESLFLNSSKKYPALPEPKKSDKDDRAASSDKHSAQD